MLRVWVEGLVALLLPDTVDLLVPEEVARPTEVLPRSLVLLPEVTFLAFPWVDVDRVVPLLRPLVETPVLVEDEFVVLSPLTLVPAELFLLSVR